MQFTSQEEADGFIKENNDYLNDLVGEALAIEGVEWADVWLNGNCPSYVAGMDEDDVQIVSFPIQAQHACQHNCEPVKA